MGRMHRNLIEMGQYSYGAIRLEEPNYQTVRVGKYTSIASGVVALMGGHHADWVSTYPFHAWPEFGHKRDGRNIAYGDIVVGSDVWIGLNVTIKGGVVIGDGAIIGATAFVNKNVEPYEIVGGIPAKHIRYRFNPDQISALLQIQWWNWNTDLVKEFALLLISSDIDKFIEACIADKRIDFTG
jgi:acetyltransferase-like isoleucine patch superfamily enzyme